MECLTTRGFAMQMETFKDMTVEKTRSAVGRFGITGKAQTQPIRNLSDGLRSRVVFAKLAYETPNMVQSCSEHDFSDHSLKGLHEQVLDGPPGICTAAYVTDTQCCWCRCSSCWMSRRITWTSRPSIHLRLPSTTGECKAFTRALPRVYYQAVIGRAISARESSC